MHGACIPAPGHDEAHFSWNHDRE